MTESSSSSKKVNVLFVCLGNICRSTMSEGVFRHLTASNPLIGTVDSAGTASYHIGAAPDSRTMRTLEGHDMTTYVHRARQVREKDMEEFDWVFAMDRENLYDLNEIRKRVVRKKGEEGIAEVRLFGSFGGTGGKEEEIEDPYYGGKEGFETAYEQAQRFSKAFLSELEERSKAGKL